MDPLDELIAKLEQLQQSGTPVGDQVLQDLLRLAKQAKKARVQKPKPSS